MKGILVGPNMVKAIMEGRKTVTRRLIKFPPASRLGEWEPSTLGGEGLYDSHHRPVSVAEYPVMWHTRTGQCVAPSYRVGETVYVKEKALYWDGGAGGCSDVIYADNPEIPHLLEDNNRLLMVREQERAIHGADVIGKWQWRSPMSMPEWAARTFLVIKSARPERLQEITDEDAVKEGVETRDWVWRYEFEVRPGKGA